MHIFFFFSYMKIEQIKEIVRSSSKIQLNWSSEKGYVFVAPSSIENEYEVVVPSSWPYGCEMNFSYRWAIYMTQKWEKCFQEISGTPLMKYSYALSLLASEIETLILRVSGFVKSHENLSQKEFANLVVDNDHFAMIMGEKRSIKVILFEARKRSPRDAVYAFYESNASGIFYP